MNTTEESYIVVQSCNVARLAIRIVMVEK